jgi:hypothetical protein
MADNVRALELGILSFAASYLATDLFALPRFFYLPIEQRWIYARHAPGPALGYPGLCLEATIVGLLVFAIARLARKRAPRPFVQRALAWLTPALVVLSLGYFTWTSLS